MTELRWVVAGMLLVVLDVRVDELDLLPDPVGWLLALVALTRLARLHRGFAVAAVGCVVGMLASVPGWVEPQPEDWVSTGSVVWETLLVFAVCTGVRALVPAERRRAEVLRWCDLGIAVVMLALVGLVVAGEPAAAPVALVVGLAGFVVFALFLLMLWRAARAPLAPGLVRAAS